MAFNCIIIVKAFLFRDAKTNFEMESTVISFILKSLTLAFIRNHTNWLLTGRRYSFLKKKKN